MSYNKIEKLKKSNTKDLEKLIYCGSISEIEEFVMINFHKIKHTISFRLILKRLREQESVIKKYKNNCESCENEKLYKLWGELQKRIVDLYEIDNARTRHDELNWVRTKIEELTK